MLKIYLLVVTEEYESYTPFKMLFISFSLGALRTCNFTHSHISPPNSSVPLGSAGVILVYGLCWWISGGGGYVLVNVPSSCSWSLLQTRTREHLHARAHRPREHGALLAWCCAILLTGLKWNLKHPLGPVYFTHHTPCMFMPFALQ